MSLVSLADAQARNGAATQDMIDEAEEWLESKIGPLIGERTETFYLSRRRDKRLVDGLWLARYTDSVAVTNDDVALTAADFLLFGHCLVERTPLGASWGETLAATYDPNDEERVRRAIFDLLDYASLATGVQSVRIGEYSESYFPRGVQSAAELNHILSGVLPSARLGAYAEPFRYAHTRRDRTLVVGSGS
jgi:hypothetical protein